MRETNVLFLQIYLKKLYFPLRLRLFFCLYIKLVTKEKHSQAGQERVKDELQREKQGNWLQTGYKALRLT